VRIHSKWRLANFSRSRTESRSPITRVGEPGERLRHDLGLQAVPSSHRALPDAQGVHWYLGELNEFA